MIIDAVGRVLLHVAPGRERLHSGLVAHFHVRTKWHTLI
jgi:hypothetical protein